MTTLTLPIPKLETARIIPFPARPMPVAAKPLSSEDRLAKALESLNTALADQRSAVAAWQGVLGELKTTTTGLDDSLQLYRTNLRALGTSVSALRAKARALELWADKVVTMD